MNGQGFTRKIEDGAKVNSAERRRKAKPILDERYMFLPLLRELAFKSLIVFVRDGLEPCEQINLALLRLVDEAAE